MNRKKYTGELAEKLTTLDRWIKSFSWSVSKDGNDAHLNVCVIPEIGDVFDTHACAVVLSCSKSDYIAFVEMLCMERVESFAVDAIHISMDGDREDTSVKIEADVHLAGSVCGKD